MLKALKGKRTIIFNLLFALLVGAAAFDWTPFVSEAGMKWVMLAQTFGNIILRFLTTTPVGQSEEK